jgi:hypothetical protein
MLGSTCRDYRSFCFLFSLKAPLSVAGTSSVNDSCLLTVARKELQLWALSVQYKEQAFQCWTRPLEIQRIVVVQHNITHEGDAANVSTNSRGGGKEQTGSGPGSLFFLAFPHHGNSLIAHIGESSQPIDRDTAVLVMIAPLGDGRRPAGCLELLNGCMQIFQDHRSWFIEALAKKHSALASLWTRFVCTHRSVRELGALGDFMTKCRCSEGPLIIRNAPPILHVANPCRHGHHSSHTGDIVFAMCSYCKLAKYCSRKCQRTGWKFSHAPHREVCEVARRVQ